jgi:hypothetical protein
MLQPGTQVKCKFSGRTGTVRSWGHFPDTLMVEFDGITIEVYYRDVQ